MRQVQLDSSAINNGTNEIGLKTIFYNLLAEKWLILIIACITLIFGITYAITKKPQYQSDILLQVEDKEEGLANLRSSYFKTSVKATPVETQSALIESRYILAPVVEELGLDVIVKPLFPPLFHNWFTRKDKAYGNLNKYARVGDFLKIIDMKVPPGYQKKPFKLISGIDKTFALYAPNGQFIMKGREGQLIKSKNEDFSILVKSISANPGTEFFIYKQSTNSIVNQIASHLEISDLGNVVKANDRTSLLRISMKGPDSQRIVEILNKIAFISLLKDIDRKSLEAAKTLDFLNKQLPLVKASLNGAETAFNKYRAKTGAIDITLESQILLKQLADLQKEIEQNELNRSLMAQKYKSMHPFMIALHEKQSLLRAQMVTLKSKLKAQPISDQKAVALMRDVKVKSELYLLLLNKIQELKVIKAGMVSDVRILNFATNPDSPLPAQTSIIIAASLILGLILGCMTALSKKALNNNIENPHAFEECFEIPALAIIPYSKKQNEFSKDYKKQLGLNILAKVQPRDMAIESLRSLRTSLQFSLIGAKNNIISLVGISPGVGKTFVSVNFSYLLAEAGRRTILIDSDIRKGHLCDYFSRVRKPGLSEILSEKANLEDVIQKTSQKNLDFIDSGIYPPNPSELLMGSRLEAILSVLSSQYDLVVIDTAPILAVTDAAIIANHAGINLLVLGSGMHQVEEIGLAIKRLHVNAMKFDGAIFNHVKKKSDLYMQSKFKYSYSYTAAT